MTVAAEIQSLSPSSLIEVFVLDMTNAGGSTVYFHAGTNSVGSPIVWQGQTYQPLPIDASGFDITTKGALPHPIFRVANIDGIFSGLVQSYAGLIGCKVIRKRTFARFLDAANFPSGNAEADPNQYLPDELWYVNRKASENKFVIEWELASPFDVQGVRLPGRQIIQNYCPWKYRGAECGYTGPAYTLSDVATTDPTQDVCAKTLTACRVRFSGTNEIVPFGGFPGATRVGN